MQVLSIARSSTRILARMSAMCNAGDAAATVLHASLDAILEEVLQALVPLVARLPALLSSADGVRHRRLALEVLTSLSTEMCSLIIRLERPSGDHIDSPPAPQLPHAAARAPQGHRLQPSRLLAPAVRRAWAALLRTTGLLLEAAPTSADQLELARLLSPPLEAALQAASLPPPPFAAGLTLTILRNLNPEAGPL